jgi:hypothetical protein
MQTNNLNIDTSFNAPTGHFGIKMLEYGECQIGTEVWIKNGLTVQDKTAFEAYMALCDVALGLLQLEEYDDLVKYERSCSAEHKETIIAIIEEINCKYKIGNGVIEEEEDTNAFQ